MSDRAKIREIFLANGFTIKPGHYDLKEYVYEAAEKLLEYQLAALKEESERLKLILDRQCTLSATLADERDALKARVAELEKERQTLADAAYSAIIAFNNLQDESLDGEARAHALLKHTDCIRNLWNIFATQDNARFKEPANEGDHHA